jgi:hypothetical protein
MLSRLLTCLKILHSPERLLLATMFVSRKTRKCCYVVVGYARSLPLEC